MQLHSCIHGSRDSNQPKEVTFNFALTYRRNMEEQLEGKISVKINPKEINKETKNQERLNYSRNLRLTSHVYQILIISFRLPKIDQPFQLKYHHMPNFYIKEKNKLSK
jgi:hypothetical protein